MEERKSIQLSGLLAYRVQMQQLANQERKNASKQAKSDGCQRNRKIKGRKYYNNNSLPSKIWHLQTYKLDNGAQVKE